MIKAIFVIDRLFNSIEYYISSDGCIADGVGTSIIISFLNGNLGDRSYGDIIFDKSPFYSREFEYPEGYCFYDYAYVYSETENQLDIYFDGYRVATIKKNCINLNLDTKFKFVIKEILELLEEERFI